MWLINYQNSCQLMICCWLLIYRFVSRLFCSNSNLKKMQWRATTSSHFLYLLTSLYFYLCSSLNIEKLRKITSEHISYLCGWWWSFSACFCLPLYLFILKWSSTMNMYLAKYLILSNHCVQSPKIFYLKFETKQRIENLNFQIFRVIIHLKWIDPTFPSDII